MKILVTGNNGYVGTILTEILLDKGYSVTGLDVNYFESCSLEPINQKLKQIVKDLRTVDIDDVVGFDSVIHLAGLSNDPLGELNPALTEEINFHGTVNIARLAKRLVLIDLFMRHHKAFMVFQIQKMNWMSMIAKRIR